MHEYLASALAAQRIAELRAEAAERRRSRKARAEEGDRRHGARTGVRIRKFWRRS
jgi:hypothetical protein